MARVYRAYHPQLNRYVAIKVLRSELIEDEESADETWRARFQREAQSVAALRHPNIVQVFDFDVQGDIYYMVMELLEGDTLKTRLNDYRARGEYMPWGESVRIMLDVLDGLAYAHSERMIHRDIKPANILLTRRGQAVLGDFGIAHIVGGTRYTMSGALMGTLQYMAPEQGMQGQSDARSDLYSLGIVFYEMLTQRTPFDADTPLAILMKHVNDPLPLPRRLNPEIPEPFERVVLKALAKRPEDRYQSAVEMAEALRAAAEEAGIELPSRISLPLSFTTTESPAEPVAVISGETRKVMMEQRSAGELTFANDETDITLGQQRLQHAATAAPQTPAVPPIPMPAAAPIPTPAPAVMSLSKPPRVPRRYSTWGAILNAILLVVFVNLVMLTVAMPTNNWAFYLKGWPIQIFLGTLGLCFIMYATGCLWMLPSIGPILTTGVLLTYSMFVGNWSHWRFSWIILVWTVIGSVVLPIWTARRKTLARGLGRILAVVLGLISIMLILGVLAWIAPGYFLTLIHAIF